MHHTIENGFCTVCGDTAEWLIEHAGRFDTFEWITFELIS
jgi:hypothetical protein